MFQFKLLSLSLLAIAALPFPCFGQDQRFIITLKENNFKELRSSGQLLSTVRGENAGKIGSVLLQFDGARSQTPVDQDPGFAIEGDKITLVVDEKMLATLKIRPIRIVLPKSAVGFRTLAMLYTESTGSVRPPSKPIVDSKGNELDTVYLTLDTAQILVGGLEGVNSLDMSTQVGSVKVLMSKVAGIRFNAHNDASSVVFLRNGDSITGQLANKELVLTTEWGSAQIDVGSLQSLTITPESRFTNQSTDFGPRWSLELGDSIAPDSPAPEAPEESQGVPTETPGASVIEGE